MPRASWPAEKLARLRELRLAGVPMSQAGKELGCSKSAAIEQCAKMGLPIVDPLADYKAQVRVWLDEGKPIAWMAAELGVTRVKVAVTVKRMKVKPPQMAPAQATHEEIYAWGRENGVDIERKRQFPRINAARKVAGLAPFASPLTARARPDRKKAAVPPSGKIAPTNSLPSPDLIAAHVAPSVSVGGSGQPAAHMQPIPRGWNDFARFHREHGLPPFDGTVTVANNLRRGKGWPVWNLCRGRILALAR